MKKIDNLIIKAKQYAEINGGGKCVVWAFVHRSEPLDEWEVDITLAPKGEVYAAHHKGAIYSTVEKVKVNAPTQEKALERVRAIDAKYPNTVYEPTVIIIDYGDFSNDELRDFIDHPDNYQDRIKTVSIKGE